MNKFKRLLLVLTLFLLMPVLVFAKASLSVDKSSVSIDAGGTAKIKITVTDAKGRVNITSDNTNVAIIKSVETLDEEGAAITGGFKDWFETKTTITKTITISGVATGTATIKIDSNGLTGNEDDNDEGAQGVKSITVTVTQKSDVCTLDGLSVKNGDTELLTGFSKDKDTYDLGTIDASKLVITATKTDSNSSVSGAGTVSLEYGTSKTLVVKVTAENGAIKKYTLKYVRKDNRDPDATLSDLKVDGITVSGFNKETLTYTLNETMSSQIKIEATCNSSKCSKITGTGVNNLNIGNNEKKVTVYAENGSTQIYTIKISRKEDTNLSLTKLVIDGKEIPLTAGVYTYSLDSTVNGTIKIEATANASDAKVTGTGTVSLNEGTNSKEVTITSKSGNTTQVYYLNIVRKGALDKVTIDGKEATVSSDGKTYSFDVSYNTEKINLKAIPSLSTYVVKVIDKKTNEEVNGEYTLSGEKAEFTIEVTNDKGTTTSYDLTINKEEAPQIEDDSESETSGTKISGNVLIVVIAVLLVVNIILAIYCVSLNNKKKKANKDNIDVI